MTRTTEDIQDLFEGIVDEYWGEDEENKKPNFNDMWSEWLASGVDTHVTPAADLLEGVDRFEDGIKGWIEDREFDLGQPEGDPFEGFDIDVASTFKGSDFGCAFGGIHEVEEVETDNYFVPKSYYCGLVCLEKMLPGLKISRVGKKEKGMTLSAFRKIMKILFTGEDKEGKNSELVEQSKIYREAVGVKEDDTFEMYMPQFYRVGVREGVIKYIKVNRESGEKCPYLILLLKHRKFEGFHAVLIKNQYCIKKGPKGVTTEDYIEPKGWNKIIKFYEEKTLGDEMIRAERFTPKKYHRYVCIWDIETCTVMVEGKRRLDPIAVGWSIVDLNEYPDNVKVNVEFGYMECMDKFLINLAEEFRKITIDDNIYCYAHNSGGFDTKYVMASKLLRWSKEISTGGRVKSLTGTMEGETKLKFHFRDSYLFASMKLKDACECYKVKNKKIDFDIVDKSQTWYTENYLPYAGEARPLLGNDWCKYLVYDVLSLGEIVYQINNYNMEAFSIPITAVLGGPGLAGQLIEKNCTYWRQVYVAKNNVTKKFIRMAVHGGRVMHNKNSYIAPDQTELFARGGDISKEVQGLISLDGNSLYPSAMYAGVYPIGLPKVFQESKVDELLGWIKKGYLFIAEVTIDTGNQRYPIHPYKEDSGMLIYKDGILTDVYTSIEIEDMLHDGYKIVSSERVILWKNTAPIFREVVGNLYDWRAKLKKAGDSRQELVKLILNSMYGKMLEQVKSTVRYEDDETEGGSLMPNGQYRNRESMANPKSTTPSHLGAFILSYSRRIMNNVIRKVRPENVFYGDTDSLYISYEAFRNSGVSESKDLGGVKNDYGDGSVIVRAIFLDFKRYYLKIRNADGTFKSKVKFNGLSFVGKASPGSVWVKNWYEKNYVDGNDDYDEMLYKFFSWFLVNPKVCNDINACVDYWDRSVGKTLIYKRELQFQVNPSKRGNWEDGNWFPLGFDKEKAFTEINKEEIVMANTRATITNPFSFSKNGYYAALPPKIDTLKGMETLSLKIDDSNFRGTPGFYLTEDNKIFMRDKKYGKIMTYSIDKFGISAELEPQIAKSMVFGVSPDYCTASILDVRKYVKIIRLAMDGKMTDEEEIAELAEIDEDIYDDEDDY